MQRWFQKHYFVYFTRLHSLSAYTISAVGLHSVKLAVEDTAGDVVHSLQRNHVAVVDYWLHGVAIGSYHRVHALPRELRPGLLIRVLLFL